MKTALSSHTEAPSIHLHHIRRLEGAVDFVDQHLTGNLSLERLSSCAAISPFHFHRLFLAWRGETVKEFVRRRRLETAAGRLRYSRGERITDVSLRCGFASSEAFARAFRDHFRMSPTQWRADGWRSWHAPLDDGQFDLPYRIDVRNHGAFDVLYQRERGDYLASTSLLWRRFLMWAKGLNLGTQPLLSMGLDDPTITAPEHCRLDAGMQVPAGWVDPGFKALRRTMGAGLYASLYYTGPAEYIGRGWNELLNNWLPASPFTLGQGTFFEYYQPNLSLPTDAIVNCELRMPVRMRDS